MNTKEIEILKLKIKQNRFIEASALADYFSSNKDNSKKRWSELSQFLLNYHFKLLSFNNDFEWADKLKRKSTFKIGKLLEQDIELEKIRLNQLLLNEDNNSQNSLIIECYKAYYGLINQDGLRTLIHMNRAIKIIELIEPNKFKAIQNDLIKNIDSSINSKSYNGTNFSLYAEFDAFLAQCSKIIKIDILDCFDIFKPNIYLDSSIYLN